MQIQNNSLVLYKNSIACVLSSDLNGKYQIKFLSSVEKLPTSTDKSASSSDKTASLQTKETAASTSAANANKTASSATSAKFTFSNQNVRAKDIILLNNGPVQNLEKIAENCERDACKEENLYNLNQENKIALEIKECWELLVSDESTAKEVLSFDDLCSLFHGEVNAENAWTLYTSLKNTVYFVQNLKSQMEGKICFSPRSQEEIQELVKKADEKGKSAQIRQEFISRLRAHKLLDEDSKFMVDVEALALGKTDKSRTLHDAKIKETPERAHKVLLDTGIWQITRNPYPIRWGLSMQSAAESLASPPEEERVKIPQLAYAIDGEHSTDPDDAISWDGKNLFVHIADPASTVMPNSSIDISARNRGATLYLPEGAVRMLCEDCLEDYALGLKENSRALTFKISFADDGSVEDCEVLKTLVNVKRLTYAQAQEQCESAELKPFFEIARRNFERRNKAGAIQITMPEVHISVDEEKKVSIEPNIHYESNEMIREMMLLAGEGAAKFAFKNNIPFPYVSQEAPNLPSSPADIPDGLAGQFRLRRCMKKRSVGVSPAMHCALGLGMYSQVTSPLRRYSDLIAHEQLRAFLDKRPLLDKDEMLMNLSAGDAAAVAAKKAERKSNTHWSLVYLLQNPNWTGKAVCVDKSQKIPLFSIPSLAMETYMLPPKDLNLNEEILVKASNINIPELTVDFIPA